MQRSKNRLCVPTYTFVYRHTLKDNSYEYLCIHVYLRYIQSFIELSVLQTNKKRRYRDTRIIYTCGQFQEQCISTSDKRVYRGDGLYFRTQKVKCKHKFCTSCPRPRFICEFFTMINLLFLISSFFRLFSHPLFNRSLDKISYQFYTFFILPELHSKNENSFSRS